MIIFLDYFRETQDSNDENKRTRIRAPTLARIQFVAPHFQCRYELNYLVNAITFIHTTRIDLALRQTYANALGKHSIRYAAVFQKSCYQSVGDASSVRFHVQNIMGDIVLCNDTETWDIPIVFSFSRSFTTLRWKKAQVFNTPRQSHLSFGFCHVFWSFLLCRGGDSTIHTHIIIFSIEKESHRSSVLGWRRAMEKGACSFYFSLARGNKILHKIIPHTYSQ